MLFDDISSIDELLAKKNEILQQHISSPGIISDKDSEIIIKQVFQDNKSVLHRFATNRSIVRETEKFTREEIST